MAGIQPEDIDVAELHDAFTILEIAESEHVGFFEKGEGAKALESGATQNRWEITDQPFWWTESTRPSSRCDRCCTSCGVGLAAAGEKPENVR